VPAFSEQLADTVCGFVNAWSGSRRGQPPALASLDLRAIEVVDDG
jgi:hypothetical protein